MRRNYGTAVLLALLLTLLAASRLSAAPAKPPENQTVFQIGDFNRSSGEFASGSPAAKVDFIVSQGTPAKDWFSSQPAVLASAKNAPESNIPSEPRAITFSLAHSPAAAYQFHVALLIESAAVPALKVQINGKTGIFYLHPKLDYNGGDQQDSFNPAYSSADVEFTFPGSYLHTGSNTITLQPVEDAAEIVPDASIHYDAIELATAASPTGSGLQSTQLVPTIFFQKQGAELAETVRRIHPLRPSRHFWRRRPHHRRQALSRHPQRRPRLRRRKIPIQGR